MNDPILPALAFPLEGENATTGTPILRAWSQWCAWFRRPKKYARKDAQPLLSFTKRKDNSRAKDAPPPEHIYALQGDYDAGKVSAGEAARRLAAAGIKAAIHTSARHTSGEPRWRVIVPLAEPITPEQLPNYMDLLNGVLGGILGRESWENERGFFFGRVEGVEYESHIVEGEYFDVLMVTEDWAPIGKPAPVKKAAEKQASVATSELPAGVEPRSDIERAIATALDNPTWFSELGSLAKTLEGKSLEDREEGVARAVVLSLPNWEPGDGFTDCESHVRAIMRRTFDKFGTKTDVQLREEVRGRFDDLSTEDLDDDPFEASQREKAAKRFTVHKGAEWAAQFRKAVLWLVRDLLSRGELAVVYGESGSGKTFWTLDAVWHIARGVAWRGQRVSQGRVVYVAAESATGFRARLRALEQQRGSVDGIDVIADAPDMLGDDDVLSLVEAIKASGENPAVVVIDTLSRVHAGNENSGEDMGKVIANCQRLHRALGCLVIVVHHSGKDQARGARGWSGIRAAVDTEVEVTKSGEGHEATVTKQKDGEGGQRYAFKLTNVELGENTEGDLLTSCIVEPAEPAPAVVGDGGGLKVEALRPNQRIAYLAARDHLNLSDRADVARAIELAASRMTRPAEGEKDRRKARARECFEALSVPAKGRGQLIWIEGDEYRMTDPNSTFEEVESASEVMK